MAVSVLVTGAAGVLGREIVCELRRAGHLVVASDRVAGSSVDVPWDVAAQDAPQGACDVDVVVHAAARRGRHGDLVEEALPLFETNAAGTLRIVQWVVRQKVRRLVLISGAIVYGEWHGRPKRETDPVAPARSGAYAVSKWCSEQVARLVETAGGELTILRPSSLYGPAYSDHLVARLIREGRETGTIRLQPPFDDAYDLLHVADAARTVRSAVEHERTGLWNIGGGGPTSLRCLADACARVTGAHVRLSDGGPTRPGRILNWVDDDRARRELEHANAVGIKAGVAEVARVPG